MNKMARDAVWIRKAGCTNPNVQVLVEVDGVWRIIYSEPLSHWTHGEVSHIVEPLGIDSSPRLTKIKEAGTHPKP